MTDETDRELLELAAKAAGFEYIKPLPEYDGRLGLELGSNPMRTQSWNPLTDDGDALRLAVGLGIDVCFGAHYVIARGSVQMPTVNNADDPYAATRRAIVRAAAEIGRRMP